MIPIRNGDEMTDYKDEEDNGYVAAVVVAGQNALAAQHNNTVETLKFIRNTRGNLSTTTQDLSDFAGYSIAVPTVAKNSGCMFEGYVLFHDNDHLPLRSVVIVDADNYIGAIPEDITENPSQFVNRLIKFDIQAITAVGAGGDDHPPAGFADMFPGGSLDYAIGGMSVYTFPSGFAWFDGYNYGNFMRNDNNISITDDPGTGSKFTLGLDTNGKIKLYYNCGVISLLPASWALSYVRIYVGPEYKVAP